MRQKLRASGLEFRSKFLFELLWREISQGRMTTMWVVPPFDPGEDRRTGFLARPEVISIEHFAFQASEETLRESVVVRIADRPHRSFA